MSLHLPGFTLLHDIEWSMLSGALPPHSTVSLQHYTDVIMDAIASQITSLTIVYSTVYWDADQRKHPSSASLAFVWGIHRGPVNSPHKWPVTWKMFKFDDVIMRWSIFSKIQCAAVFTRSIFYGILENNNWWFDTLTYIVLQSVQCCMKYHAILDHSIMARDCIPKIHPIAEGIWLTLTVTLTFEMKSCVTQTQTHLIKSVLIYLTWIVNCFSGSFTAVQWQSFNQLLRECGVMFYFD